MDDRAVEGRLIPDGQGERQSRGQRDGEHLLTMTMNLCHRALWNHAEVPKRTISPQMGSYFHTSRKEIPTAGHLVSL